jgi:hypothetical protein
MAAEKTRKPAEPRTLMEAHDALVKIRPKSAAPLEQWRAYYEQSAALYAEIAEIDRGHHHEALYWADKERRSAEEIAAKIEAAKSSSEPTKDRR